MHPLFKLLIGQGALVHDALVERAIPEVGFCVVALLACAEDKALGHGGVHSLDNAPIRHIAVGRADCTEYTTLHPDDDSAFLCLQFRRCEEGRASRVYVQLHLVTTKNTQLKTRLRIGILSAVEQRLPEGGFSQRLRSICLKQDGEGRSRVEDVEQLHTGVDVLGGSGGEGLGVGQHIGRLNGREGVGVLCHTHRAGDGLASRRSRDGALSRSRRSHGDTAAGGAREGHDIFRRYAPRHGLFGGLSGQDGGRQGIRAALGQRQRSLVQGNAADRDDLACAAVRDDEIARCACVDRMTVSIEAQVDLGVLAVLLDLVQRGVRRVRIQDEFPQLETGGLGGVDAAGGQCRSQSGSAGKAGDGRVVCAGLYIEAQDAAVRCSLDGGDLRSPDDSAARVGNAARQIEECSRGRFVLLEACVGVRHAVECRVAVAVHLIAGRIPADGLIVLAARAKIQLDGFLPGLPAEQAGNKRQHFACIDAAHVHIESRIQGVLCGEVRHGNVGDRVVQCPLALGVGGQLRSFHRSHRAGDGKAAAGHSDVGRAGLESGYHAVLRDRDHILCVRAPDDVVGRPVGLRECLEVGAHPLATLGGHAAQLQALAGHRDQLHRDLLGRREHTAGNRDVGRAVLQRAVRAVLSGIQNAVRVLPRIDDRVGAVFGGNGHAQTGMLFVLLRVGLFLESDAGALEKLFRRVVEEIVLAVNKAIDSYTLLV